MHRNCFRAAKPLLEVFLFSNSTGVKGCNERCVIKRWAGHSKWSNIKHVKQAKDAIKSSEFNKVAKKIQLAVKEGGPDPNMNNKLKTVLEEAKKISMPTATIQNAIKVVVSKGQEKPKWVVYVGPSGQVIGFEVTSSSLQTAYSKLNAHMKKINFLLERKPVDLYVEKGIVVSQPLQNVENSLDKALEDGINVGMEEVYETDDKTLVFECMPTHVEVAHKKLEDLGYEILSSGTELEFSNYYEISEKEREAVKLVIEKIQRSYDELLRVADNFKES